jgi:hypothetical protein
MHPYMLQKMAADHISDMHAEAAAQRLARLARRERRAARARRGGLQARSAAEGYAMPTAGAPSRATTDPVAGSDKRELASQRAA